MGNRKTKKNNGGNVKSTKIRDFILFEQMRYEITCIKEIFPLVNYCPMEKFKPNQVLL